MTLRDVLTLAYQRGVSFLIVGDALRARGKSGAVNDALRAGLATHKQELIAMLGDGLHPDPLIPDRVTYPASLPNDDQSFERAYAAQRLKAA
jgi:hypothetical protein